MDGILSLIKPPGITSHDAVGLCRRILREKRIGHSGTLDPMAYGVLPIFLGKATRLIQYTESFDKTYIAECRFGTFTDTEDASGQEVDPHLIMGVLPLRKEDNDLSLEAIQAVCNRFLGDQEQVPSIYSAIKINGKRAYEYARAGQIVEMPSRSIHIAEIRVIAYRYPYFTVAVTCSGGTYIRSLLRDICKALGRPGTMTQLCQSQVGPFLLQNSYMAEELMLDGSHLLLPADRALQHLARVDVSEQERLRLIQGKELPIHSSFSHTQSGQLYRAYYQDDFMSILRCTDTSLRVEKNIFI